jgi:hypothetical protein
MSFQLPGTIQLTKNKDFLVKGTEFSTGIEFISVTDPETREALLQNEPFPKEARLLDIKVKGEAGHDIAFLGKEGKVHFKASAFAGFGVYQSPEKLIKDLELSDEIEEGIVIPGGLKEYLLALRWGYDVDAKAQGSVALGAAGQVAFGGEVQRDATYAVIRRFPQETKSFTAIEALANSWMLPTHVKGIADLEPGTWLIAEVNGSIAANIGITYGLDFNWVREIKQGGLAGDIGLRLQVGLQASLGFNASGKYAVVLSRESMEANQQEVRLRIFKQRTKGWNFALNAGATVQGVAGFLPDNYDDLIKAVFGVHGAQVVKGLKNFDKWTNDKQTLPEILAEAGLGEAQKLLEAVTGKNPLTEFEDAKKLVVDFLNEWTSLDTLNHKVSTLIFKILGEIKDKAKLTEALGQIKEIAGEIEGFNLQKVKELLAERLQDVDFFRTPVGKWLEALAAEGILKALSGQDEFQKLQEAAAATKRVLDGGPVEDVLKKLQDFIEKNLGDELKKLEAIKNKISQADLDKLANTWLAARLTTFLGDTLDLEKLEQIRLGLQTIRKKTQAYYDTGLKALTKQYKFSYAYTYQQATTKTALLDVVFDLSKANTSTWLSEAVDGEFNQLLIQKNDGVTLREAHLTHQIERNSHVTISTPFFGKETEHSNKSFADFTPVEEDGKLLMTYSLAAKDVVEVKNRLVSQLAVGGSWKVGKNNKVNEHSPSSLSYAYSFRQTKSNMGRADLQYQLQPYVDQYFKSSFSSPNNGLTSGSFDLWLSTLDDKVEQSLHNGPDNFGDTLLSLELSVPAAVTASWLDAPDVEKDDEGLYMNMSLRLQEAIKTLVPYLYFQDPKRFTEIASAAGILVYAALPPSTRITGIFPDIHMDTRTGVYWDYLNPAYYQFMLNHAGPRLAGILEGIQARLAKTPEHKDEAKNYAPNRAQVFLTLAGTDPKSIANLKALLNFESTVINGILKAGLAIAKFKKESPDEPAKAIEALANFGARVTEIFNGSISKLHGGDKSRPIATLLFVEAAKALNPTLQHADPIALLELIVLKANAPFKSKLASYIAGELPSKDETLIEQRLVSLA